MVVKIVLGVAIALMLATAYFGFQTKGTILGLRDDLKNTKETLQTTRGTLAKTQADLKTSQDFAASETQRADAATADATASKADAQKANDLAKDTQTKLDAANAQVDDLNKKIANMVPNAAPGDNPELIKLQNDLKDAQAKLAELETVKTTLEAKASAAEATAKDLKDKEAHRQAGLMRPGLEGQVLAVNNGFNFVVLSLGDHQGAVMNAEMLVVHGDTKIAKVRITSVEPSTSVADVVPGSQARGSHIQPGDTVIYKQ